MTVELNHTIVWCRDKQRSAAFLTELLDLPPPVPFGPMLVVALGNGVSMDYYDSDAFSQQHYAFLLDEAGFDALHAKLRSRGLAHWADPARQQANRINHHFGGRGVYFEDPDGHLLEAITRPYDLAAFPTAA